jgi:gluconolactonase
VRTYAQTNIQLFNQLRAEGYSKNDAALVRDAYELAMELYSARFTSSGRPFMAHVVGAASVMAALRFPAPAVAAALLHNVYATGDFGDGRSAVSPSRHRKLRRAVGPEVERYVAGFSALYWEPGATQTARRDPNELDAVERTVFVILFAEHLDHLLDRGLLYYDKPAIDFYASRSRLAAEIADRFELPSLAAELREAIGALESAELPVEPSLNKILNGEPVLAPASCRKRLSVAARQTLIRTRHRLRSGIRRRLKGIRRRVPQSFAGAWKNRRTVRANFLQGRSDNFAALFCEQMAIERVATGFQFTEGPVWIEEERSLLFSDIPANRIFRLSPDGRVGVFSEPSGNSNGLTRDRQGRLIACEDSNRRVTRTEKDGTIVSLAEKFQEKTLNSPNDVVVKSDGAVYFTDPFYGNNPCNQEQPFQGVYRLSPDGELSQVAADFARPNGLAFSPDERKLYIDDSERRHIRAFDVRADGSLAGGAVFHDMNISTPGAPDGMKVDAEGRVYCTGAGGVWVFEPDGKHLGTIVVPEKPSNCAWGDSDWRSLYITACTSVYRTRATTPGIPVP